MPWCSPGCVESARASRSCYGPVRYSDPRWNRPSSPGLLDLAAAHTAALRCERAAAARLLTVAGRAYEFANDLIQEVLYTSTPAPTRIAHHLRAADLLAAPEAVAAHAAAAARATGRRPRGPSSPQASGP